MSTNQPASQQQLLALLRQRPFQPFRLHLTDGRVFDIVYPELNIAGRSMFAIGVPEAGVEDPFADYFEDVDYPLIRQVEMLPSVKQTAK